MQPDSDNQSLNEQNVTSILLGFSQHYQPVCDHCALPFSTAESISVSLCLHFDSISHSLHSYHPFLISWILSGKRSQRWLLNQLILSEYKNCRQQIQPALVKFHEIFIFQASMLSGCWMIQCYNQKLEKYEETMKASGYICSLQ